MKIASRPSLVSLVLGLLGAASAQLTGFATCEQGAEGPDPGVGNYGDLLCYFRPDNPSTYPLIERTVVFTTNSTETGYIVEGLFAGYEVDYVWYLNFGRERGVVTKIQITNHPVGDIALVHAEVEFTEGSTIRMFLEIYGTVRYPAGGANTSITVDTKPKFVSRTP